MGTPTLDDQKSMIQTNLIKNNKVTTYYVNLTIESYGTDVGKIKGKTKRSRPMPVFSNIVDISKDLMEAQQDLAVSMNGLTVHSLKFLSTISHELEYRTAQYV